MQDIEHAEKAHEASKGLQKRKALTIRMRDYANDLNTRIQEKVQEEGEEDEVYKLSYIRRAVLYAFRQVVRASAWLLDQIEKLATWISELLAVGSKPVTGTFEKAKTWFKGVDPEEERRITVAA